MREYPKGGIIGKTVRLLRWLADLRIPVYASHACYFIVLALFPMLVLLLSLIRYTGLDVKNLSGILEGVIPSVLMPAAEKLIISTYQSTTGTVVSVSALTALWSASRGIHGLMTGLNSIYGVSEDRGYFYTRSVSLLYTFLFLLVLLLTLVLHVFGATLLQMLPADGGLLRFLSEVVDLRFFLLLGVQTVLFTAVFTVLPNRRNSIMGSLPGAVFASVGWLVFSALYSVYVEHFSGYSNIYGSVYAVALSMLWLYFCVSIVFYGGALNELLAQNREKRER